MRTPLGNTFGKKTGNRIGNRIGNRVGGWLVWAVAASVLLGACGGSPAVSSPAASGPAASGPAASSPAASSPAASAASGAGTPVKGGKLVDAIASDPPTLDWAYSTSTITFSVSWHIFEQLFALDHGYKPQPMLATGYKASVNGLAYTIGLRQGVHFHNGQVFKAADAVASIERWGKVSSIGRQAFQHIKAVSTPDDHTVQISLKTPFSPLIPDLAAFTQACIMIPANVAKAAGNKPLTNAQAIGTGPYKLKEWVHGQVVKLVRFDGYTSRTENQGGVAGKKVAYIDELDFRIVPDAQQRLNGLITGEFDFATDLSPDSYSQLKSSSSAAPLVTPADNTLYVVFNSARAPFNNVKLREAVNLVTDKKQIAAAAFGPPAFWQLDDAMFMPDQKLLYTTVGKKVYEQHDPAKAKALFQQEGYDMKRPVRILVTKTYMYMYDGGVALAQELNQIGIKTKILVYDWPTDLARRKDKSAWDIFLTGFSEKFDPTQDFWISPTFSGGYQSAKMQALLNQWGTATTVAQRKQLMDKIQGTEWQELPAIKIANQKSLFGARNRLHDYRNYLEPRFWNDWVTKG
ncbi:MAG: ABC transporter substrate-binding protein [Chloroflexota bacterium]